MNNQAKINIAIIGGTGYTGKELLKILSIHPNVDKIIVYAKSSAGKMICDIFPELLGLVEDSVILSADDLDFTSDVYFTALPHGESLLYIPQLVSAGKKVIDIGGDFRLDKPELYRQWYGFEHSVSDLLSQKLYGLADLTKEYEYKYNLISNPGCYPTAALLPLTPVVKYFSESILSISTAAYSGVSGVGKSPKTELLMAEMHGNAKAYNLNKHRHEPEILQELIKSGLGNTPFCFSTHLLPIATGIHCTSIVHLTEPLEQDEVDAAVYSIFERSTFVRIRKIPPEVKWVVGTNYCDMHFAVGADRIIVTSVIDNLIKGASGQAVQNMNKMLGLDETAGFQINKHFSLTN